MVSETGVDWKTYFVPLDRNSQKPREWIIQNIDINIRDKDLHPS
jgi:hypothetical protein